MGLLILVIVLFACRRRSYSRPYWHPPYYRGYGPYPMGGPDSRWHPYYGYPRSYGYRPYWW